MNHQLFGRLLAASLVACLVCWPAIALATDIHVAKTGNDVNPGTLGSPKLTILAGLTGRSPGDRVIVHAGSYRENLTLPHFIPPSGTSGNPITLMSNPGDTVTLLNGNAAGDTFIEFTGTDWFVMKDFQCNGEFDTAAVEADAMGVCIKFNSGSTNIVIDNVDIYQTRCMGIFLNGGAAFNEIKNSDLHHNGNNCPGAGGGNDLGYDIYNDSGNLNVHHNDMHDGPSYAIQSYDQSGGDLHDIRICDNRIWNKGQGTPSAGAIVSGGIGDNLICNNQIFNNTGYGIALGTGDGTYGMSILHNTIYGNSGPAVVLNPMASVHDNIIRNNILFGNGTDAIVDNSGNGTNVKTPNTTSDPAFVNAAAGNFHLTALSLARGAGVAGTGVTTDFDGVARGNPPDAGAYQYSGGGGGPSPPLRLRILSSSVFESPVLSPGVIQ